MTINIEELKRLAKAAIHNMNAKKPEFIEAATPAAVLELIADNERLCTELAASQAREIVVRETLHWYGQNAFNGYGDSIMGAAKAVLAGQPDHSALDAALQRAREEMRARCERACEANRRDEDDDMDGSSANFNIGVDECLDSIRALEVKP